MVMAASAIATLTRASRRANSNSTHSSLVGNVYRDLIVEPRRRTQAGRPIVSPKNAEECLFACALGRGDHPIATQVFHLVVCSRVSSARHVGRRRRAELSRRVEHEWDAFAPV